jgi:hypothetical protein
MNTPVKIASLISLLLVVVPCLLFFLGMVDLNVVKWTALVGTIGWFIATPMWMSRELSVDASEVEI